MIVVGLSDGRRVGLLGLRRRGNDNRTNRENAYNKALLEIAAWSALPRILLVSESRRRKWAAIVSAWRNAGVGVARARVRDARRQTEASRLARSGTDRPTCRGGRGRRGGRRHRTSGPRRDAGDTAVALTSAPEGSATRRVRMTPIPLALASGTRRVNCTPTRAAVRAERLNPALRRRAVRPQALPVGLRRRAVRPQALPVGLRRRAVRPQALPAGLRRRAAPPAALRSALRAVATGWRAEQKRPRAATRGLAVVTDALLRLPRGHRQLPQPSQARVRARWTGTRTGAAGNTA
jgi:hypothetical protein